MQDLRPGFPKPPKPLPDAPGPWTGAKEPLDKLQPSQALSASPMPVETFRASRWTRGNFLFPTYIDVSDRAVLRRKRSWFHSDEMSISLTKVASVHIKTGLIWSDILIESSGGSDPLSSHGHSKADAERIKELIESAQAVLGKAAPE